MFHLANLLVAGLLAQQPDPSTAIAYPQYPALSPDGSTVVVSWAGDLWAASVKGGVATRLSAHPAHEGRSAFSADGGTLAFESNRDGARNIYTMRITGSGGDTVGSRINRITYSDSSQTLSGFSEDGGRIYFSSTQHPRIYNHRRMFGVSVDGGPVSELLDVFGQDPRAHANDLLFTRGRNLANRPAYLGPAAPDIFRYNTASGAFDQLTSFEGTDEQARPGPNGSIVFVSSRSGQNNIWMIDAGDTGARARQLTEFEPDTLPSIGHGVRDLDVSLDRSTAAFCVWDTLYTLDLSDPEAWPQPVRLSAAADASDSDQRRISVADAATGAAISPDGQTIAIVARGDVFIKHADNEQPARAVTATPARESDLAWSPDGGTLYFSADTGKTRSIMRAVVDLTRDDLTADGDADAAREQSEQQDASESEDSASDEDESDDDGPTEPTAGDRWADALAFRVHPVIDSDQDERDPRPSPDGRKLLYTRGFGELVLRDLDTNEDRTLLTGWDEPGASWAADARHIVFVRSDLDFNTDIWLLDTANPDASPINITRHPDLDLRSRLTADGRTLYFLSERAGENDRWDVWRINLDRLLDDELDYVRRERIEKLQKELADRKPIDLSARFDVEPFTFDTDDAYLRAERVTSGIGNADELAITPAGDRLLIVVQDDGAKLISVDHEGNDNTTVDEGGGGIDALRISLDGKKISYVRQGRARVADTSGGGDVETLTVDARIEIDREAQLEQKFLEAARVVGNKFYHPTLKGLDWPALTARYLSLARTTRSTQGFNRVVETLFGELNGSHLGIRGGDTYSTTSPNVGHLGVVTEPTSDGHVVTRVVANGPATGPEAQIEPGEIITAVNGSPIHQLNGTLIDLGEALLGTADRETIIELRHPDRVQRRYALLKPIGWRANRVLMYNDEVAQRRKAVDERSNGRLGYLHIRAMGTASVRAFERDLFAAANGKEGLIIDVRDNTGGWTTDILLASLTAPAHAYTVPRGADRETAEALDAYPRGRRLIYGYTRPINVVINQHAFSNGEIFSHAIKTTKRGRLIGTQTFGGVISTGSHTLIDGARVRTPFRGWYLPDGTDMELNGARPDVDIPMTPADELAGRDPQLDAAVDDLLSQIDR